jgi:hypothetical protein
MDWQIPRSGAVVAAPSNLETYGLKIGEKIQILKTTPERH